MPTTNDLLTNTQGQANTVSNNGSNRVAGFKANSHFFLEDGTFTQSQAQAFGIISDDEFCTTANVSVTGKKIISVCTGQIFVQPQSGTNADPNKVNVVLKPYKQPINGLSVKYFVYRGLPKSDFFDSNSKVNAAGTGATGLVNYIRSEFSSFYANIQGGAPDFLATFIGYPGTSSGQQETDYIDSYFAKVSQTYDNETIDPKLAFELPMVPAGTHLATVTGEVGFDIILNDGDYYLDNDPNPFKVDLKYARAAKHVLNVTTVSDAYQKKVLREACTRFIDPAAYYGIHANGGSIFKFGVTQAVNTPANIAALIAAFYTKSNIYIYIQSNRQRSYNFYGTQKISDTNTNNIKIGVAENSLSETTFETNKWPVKIFNTAASGARQTVVLKLTTDRSSKTTLFGRMANISSVNQEGFVDAANLVEPADVNGNISNLTKSVTFSSPANSNQNIASFIQLVYMGREIVLSRPGIDDNDPNTPAPDPVFFTAGYMDDVFYLTQATSFLVIDNIYSVHSYVPTVYSQQDIEKHKNAVAGYTQKTQHTVEISQSQSLTLITYLSIAEHEQSDHSNFEPNASANKEATGYNRQDTAGGYTLPNLPGNEFVDLSMITDATEQVMAARLRTSDGSLPTTLVLGITQAENDALKTLMNNTRNPRLYFEPLFGNDAALLSDDKQYQKFKLGILVDTAAFGQEITMPANDIVVLSLDGLIFCSGEYAAAISQFTENDFYTILTI